MFLVFFVTPEAIFQTTSPEVHVCITG